MLTEAEKERVRYHLGYPLTSFGGNQAAASIQFGIPKPLQTSYLVEEAIQILLTNEHAIDRVRKVLTTMDHLEQKIEAAACTLGAEKLGELTLRGATQGETHPDLLEREYIRWGYRLADLLGVPPYAYSKRYRDALERWGNVAVKNIPVVR